MKRGEMIGFSIKRVLFPFFLALSFSFAQQLEVTADRFTHVEKENKAIFEGNAHAIEGKSRVDADRFVIFLDKNNEAREYLAKGNVSFEIVKPDQHVKGSCKELIYYVSRETYLLKGGAHIVDMLNKREMIGEELFLDNRKKEAKARSDHRAPVKLIFQMKEAKKSKKRKGR